MMDKENLIDKRTQRKNSKGKELIPNRNVLISECIINELIN